MDKINSRLLQLLQKDARLSIAELAEDVNLSISACHRRIKLLEESGLITGYTAQLDGKALGYDMQVYIEVSLNAQSDESLNRFEEAVSSSAEILECHLMAGDADYLLKIAALNTEHYEEIHRRVLSRLPGVVRLKSNFVLRTVQPWKGYLVDQKLVQ